MIDIQDFELLLIATQTPNAVILSEAKDLTYAPDLTQTGKCDPPAIVSFPSARNDKRLNCVTPSR